MEVHLATRASLLFGDGSKRITHFMESLREKYIEGIVYVGD